MCLDRVRKPFENLTSQELWLRYIQSLFQRNQLVSLSYTYVNTISNNWQCYLLYSCLDCERIHFIDETDSDLVRVFKAGESAALNMSFNTQISVNAAELSYQACNDEWTPLNNTASAWGIKVTRQWASAKRDYLLTVRGTEIDKASIISVLLPTMHMTSSQRTQMYFRIVLTR